MNIACGSADDVRKYSVGYNWSVFSRKNGRKNKRVITFAYDGTRTPVPVIATKARKCHSASRQPQQTSALGLRVQHK